MNIGVNGGIIFKNVATRTTGSTSPMIVTTIRKVSVESNYPVVSYQMGSLFWDDRYFGIQKHLKQHNEDIAITSVVRTQLTESWIPFFCSMNAGTQWLSEYS